MANTLAKNIFITGQPGCGKTCLIKNLASKLQEYGPVGFYTEEIREQSARKGFKLMGLDNTEAGVLAHVGIRGQHRVGKYGVDLAGFEKFLWNLRLVGPLPQLVIIDEIGKMECLSEQFRGLVVSLLDAPAPVIATIALKAGGFIDNVKHRPDVLLYEITGGNRESLLPKIVGHVQALLASRLGEKGGALWNRYGRTKTIPRA